MTTDPPPEVSTFSGFDLDERLVAAVDDLGWTEPTPIQLAAIPVLLAGGDLVGGARTGSGKTAAFALPLLHRLRDGGGNVRALILTPTRELALQVTAALRGLASGLPVVRIVTVYGGASYEPQLRALSRGVSIVVGTPGRVLDHLDRGTLDLSTLEVLVLDEADEMLRMGFLEDVEKVLESCPADRQVALFSATMPDPIRRVAQRYLRNPTDVQVEDQPLTVEHIDQRWVHAPRHTKLDVLARLLRGEASGAALVFCRTRRDTAEVADALAAMGADVDALHGDLNQAARERVLGRLRAGRLTVLVATDVAARGIDVDHISHVINYDLPDDAEMYVHRIGRTGRAGREGIAISLVTSGERKRLRAFQRALGVDIIPMRAPSEARIAAARRDALSTEITVVAAEVGDAARAWWETLVEASELSSDDLAVAALELLARERGVDLDVADEDEDEDEEPLKELGRDSSPAQRVANECELFLPVGRRHGVRPADLVGALTADSGIPGNRIGRITVYDRKSFVGMELADAEEVLRRVRQISVRGTAVRIGRAHRDDDRPPSEPGYRPVRGRNKGRR